MVKKQVVDIEERYLDSVFRGWIKKIKKIRNFKDRDKILEEYKKTKNS